MVAAATLWCLFSLVLFLPLVGAPSQLRRSAAVLLALQFVALNAYGYGAAAPYFLATHDLPLLTFVLISAAAAYGLREARRSAGSRAARRR